MSTAAARDPMDSLRNEIAERESKRERLQTQLADARKEHIERRRALVDGECTADEVVAAESRVNVLESAIAEIDAELAPRRTQVEDELARRAAVEQRRQNLAEVTELARKAATHSQAYVEAQSKLIRAAEEAYDVLSAENKAAMEAVSMFDQRVTQLEVSLYDVNREVPLKWLAPFAHHVFRRSSRPYEHGTLDRFASADVGQHFQDLKGRPRAALNEIVKDALKGLPR